MSALAASLKTKRLVLTPFEPTEATYLFGFMADASAMQHTYVATSYEHCLARLQAYEATRKTLGFAPWVVRAAQDGQVVGWGGLSIDPLEPEWGLEVIYAFAPRAWGLGYATELVQASLGFAFNNLGVPEVHAFAKQENAASARVLQKCGFSLLRYEPALERDHFVAASTRAA
jgi:RimJ/RimL family protein N-acetyltransferase